MLIRHIFCLVLLIAVSQLCISKAGVSLLSFLAELQLLLQRFFGRFLVKIILSDCQI